MKIFYTVFVIFVLAICHSYYISEGDGSRETNCEDELARIDGNDSNGGHLLQGEKHDEELEFYTDQGYSGKVWSDEWRN